MRDFAADIIGGAGVQRPEGGLVQDVFRVLIPPGDGRFHFRDGDFERAEFADLGGGGSGGGGGFPCFGVIGFNLIISFVFLFLFFLFFIFVIGFLLGVGLLVFPFLFGGKEGGFLGNEVVAALLDQRLVDAEDVVEMALDMFGDFGVQGHFGEQRAVAGEHGGGEGIEQGAAGGGGEVGGLGGEVFGGFAHFLAGEPFAIAAEVPVGEVLRADEVAAVVFFDEGEDFGELVEPKQNVVAGFAVAEALVEFFAEGFGETGEFAGTVHRLNEGGGLMMEDGFICGAVGGHEGGWWFRKGTQRTNGT